MRNVADTGKWKGLICNIGRMVFSCIFSQNEHSNHMILYCICTRITLLSQLQAVSQVHINRLKCLDALSLSSVKNTPLWFQLSIPCEGWHFSEMAEVMQQL